MGQRTASRLRALLADTLLIQADTKSWEPAVECSNRSGGGLVLTGDDYQMLDAAGHVMRRGGYTRPILVDRALYTGTKRKLAKHPFDAEWISRQRRLPVAAVMPDSGYVGAGDVEGLKTILARIEQLGAEIDQDVIALLPLHLSWLDADRGLDTLINEVNQAAVPIAIALEDEGDPLSLPAAVEGLVALLTSPVPVVVLRCDISALGALSCGALAAAVGTSTGLRHIYPSKSGGEVFVPSPQPAAIVKPLLSYLALDTIVRIVQADSDNPLWRCDCDYCGGRSLALLRALPESSAYMHSLDTLYHIRSDIIGRNVTLRERQQSWCSQCSHALYMYRSIRRSAPSLNLRRPKALAHWDRLLTQSLREQPSPDRESPGRPAPPPTD